jgi:hypothetical protein
MRSRKRRSGKSEKTDERYEMEEENDEKGRGRRKRRSGKSEKTDKRYEMVEKMMRRGGEGGREGVGRKL